MMYSHSYSMPNNMNSMYRNDNSYVTYDNYPYQNTTYQGEDDRFFFAPFLVGGLAGTALGYGIANNNQLNSNKCCYQPMMWQPMYQPMYPAPYAISSSSNNYFY